VISYFVIQLLLTIYIEHDGANLLDLVRLRQRTARLQTQDIRNSGLAEDVMPPTYPLREAQASQQRLQVLEMDVGV
jgi:hypothetical protein